MKTVFAIFIVFILFVSSASVQAVFAQSFKFQLANPASPAASEGGTFQVNVLINTAGEETINGDVLFTYDPAAITIDKTQVKKPSPEFYTYLAANPLAGSNNKFLISSWEESVANPKKSQTDTLFAIMTVKAVKAGTSSLAFNCVDANEADTNINRASDSKDIVKCSELKSLSFNIGAGPLPTATLTPGPTGTPSATPTKKPTSTPAPTNTPRPTVAELPRSGAVEVTFAALGLGLVLTVMGILLIL